MAELSIVHGLIGAAILAAAAAAGLEAYFEQRERRRAEREVRQLLDSLGRGLTPGIYRGIPPRRPRPIDPRSTLKPRIVERDGFAYAVLERPTPQKGLSQ